MPTSVNITEQYSSGKKLSVNTTIIRYTLIVNFIYVNVMAYLKNGRLMILCLFILRKMFNFFNYSWFNLKIIQKIFNPIEIILKIYSILIIVYIRIKIILMCEVGCSSFVGNLFLLRVSVKESMRVHVRM